MANMNNIVEYCERGEHTEIGLGSILRYVRLGKNSKIWHYCNIYGTREEVVKIGEDTQVGSYSEIKPGVVIGDHCRFQSYIFIPAGTIEDYVFLGPGVRFHNDKHPSALKTHKNHWKEEPVQVKSYASIGGGALIGPGVTIGRCAVVGLGSVVIHDVPDYAIVCRNPAKQIGDVRAEKYKKLFLPRSEGD